MFKKLINAIKIFKFVLKTDNEYTVKDGYISDGYHTFDELYKYRMLYNAAFVNEYAKLNPESVEKSSRHSDGEICFGGGWFIVNINLPTGLISNHYKIEDWNHFLCNTTFAATFKYDGHTPKDVIIRLERYFQMQKQKKI